MSSITLSSATRQNLLVAQDTASLLSTTQNRLATGKKVNSALDSPSSFFTAQGLDNRAGDLSNILDSISNGVQVIQAANTGITSLQKLVDNAKSVANQALQATIGYSTKSNVSTTITGATASDLRGTTTYANAKANSNILYTGAANGTTAADGTAKIGGAAASITSAVLKDNQSTPAIITADTFLYNDGSAASKGGLAAASPFSNGDKLTVNGKSIEFKTGAAPSTLPSGYASVSTTGATNVATDGSGNSIIYIGGDATASAAKVSDVLAAIDLASGVRTATLSGSSYTIATTTNQSASSVTSGSGGGSLQLNSTLAGSLSISGPANALKALGLTGAAGTAQTTVVSAPP